MGRGNSLHIALTADPELPVPPKHYGGIERIVDMLARGLVAHGHRVTVFADPESDTAGELEPWPGKSSRAIGDTLRNATFLARRVNNRRFDVVHSFSRLAYLSALLPTNIPKLMSYQRAVSPQTVRLAHALSRGTLQFSAISHHMTARVRDIGIWHYVPNGVPLTAFAFSPDPGPGAPLVFLGRVEEIKGPHIAIEVAQRTGLPLVIAGNIPAEHRGWFTAKIAPHIDGKQISYVGPVDDVEKNLLLGRARALLMPILWEEPFGIVMTEAMACGTPVIGLARGAVPEVVETGVTGFVCDDIAGVVAAVGHLRSIERTACRARVERLFSATAIVDEYASIYSEMLRQ